MRLNLKINFLTWRTIKLVVICILVTVIILYINSVKRHQTKSKQVYEIDLADNEIQEKMSTDSKDENALQNIREMTRSSWSSYYLHCGKNKGNELQPVTNSCSTPSDSIVGPGHLLTAVDALDTLHLMGLSDEFQQAREMVKTDFKLTKGLEVSVFEVTIRILGGFLGAFSRTQDPLFKEKAREVGEGLIGAFNGPLVQRRVQLFHNASPSMENGLAEAGSLYLEFVYLSEITGDPKFAQAAIRNQKTLLQMPNIAGLYPNGFSIITNGTAKNIDSKYSVGSEADSFYEYLVKRCIFDKSPDPNCRQVFTRSLDTIMKKLNVNLGNSGSCLTNLGDQSCNSEHLSCFAGGMYCLAYLQNPKRKDWLQFAANITKTCYLSYLHSPTGLGPERYFFEAISGKMVAEESWDFNLLRPELVETLYYMYYVTRNENYRHWGRHIIHSLRTKAYVRSSGGYSGLTKISSTVEFDNTQWSFFLAETLKYLHLLFSKPSDLLLDDWLFNTEAHFLPTRKNVLRQ